MIKNSVSAKPNALPVYGRYVTIAVFLLIAAGPISQLIAFARATGTLQWMQTAYDEPFYINAALGPLSLGERTLSQLPAHLMQALGIVSFDAIAIISSLIIPLLAFWVAWILAGNLTREAIERSCWALALVFGFQLFSLNSSIIFSPSLAERLEKLVGMPWLFAADPFPYFNLYRIPEPQTTWIVFFVYLHLIVRFADTLEVQWYRRACLATPLFAFCYITVAISAWILFIALSLYCIVALSRPIKIRFAVTSLATSGLLGLMFAGQNGREAAATIFHSHLPILRMSVVIALIAVGWTLWRLRRKQWQPDPRLALAGACASIPLIDLNQQLLTGAVIYAQQWELYCNYACLVLALGLLANTRNQSTVLRSRGRSIITAGILLIISFVIAAGHRYTYRAFLPTNLLSVVEARAYREVVKSYGPISAIILTHFWDDSLFRIRVPDTVPVIGGATWMMQHPVLPVDHFQAPDAYLEGNADSIAVGYEALSRQEYDAGMLRQELDKELAQGVCWPAAGYFIAPRDCWNRLSNYTAGSVHDLRPWTDVIVRHYAEFLQRKRSANTPSSVLVMRREPIDSKTRTGLWHYQAVGEFSLSADGTTATVYAYWQFPRGINNATIPQLSNPVSH